MPAVYITLLTLSVIIGAVADGLNEKGSGDAGHFVEMFEKPLLLIAGVLMESWIVIFPYVAFRVAFFDIIKNLAKGQKWSYVGDVGWWDKTLKRIPTHGVTFCRVIFLIFAVAFTILEF